jgi:hypothetical protein
MTAPQRHSPRQNHLLNALPASDYERLASHLELIPMRLGEVLYEPGVQLRYVYFPTTSNPRCLIANARQRSFGSMST